MNERNIKKQLELLLKTTQNELLLKEFAQRYIELGGCLAKVPFCAIDQELCTQYIANNGELYYVPKEYINQELCELAVKKGRDIKTVGYNNRTKLMKVYYVENGGDIRDAECHDPLLAAIYLLKGGDKKHLKYTPNENMEIPTLEELRTLLLSTLNQQIEQEKNKQYKKTMK